MNNISHERVVELAHIANNLSSDEFYVLIGAFGLNAAQEVACDYIKDEPEEYTKGVRGVHLWDDATNFLEDWLDVESVTKAVREYQVYQHYNIDVKHTIVITPKRV